MQTLYKHISIFYIYITQRAKKLRFIHLSADRIAVWLYRSVYPSAKCKIQTELNDTRIYTRDERCKKNIHFSPIKFSDGGGAAKFSQIYVCFFPLVVIVVVVCFFFVNYFLPFRQNTEFWEFVEVLFYFSLLYLGSYFFPLSHGNKARYFVVYLPV